VNEAATEAKMGRVFEIYGQEDFMEVNKLERV